MRVVRLALIAFVFCVVAVLTSSSGRAQESPALEFAASTALNVTFKHDTHVATKTVSVVNNSDKPLSVRFCIVIEGASPTTCDTTSTTVTVPTEQQTIAPDSVQAVQLTFTVPGDNDKPVAAASGQLVMRSDAGIDPSARPITITQMKLSLAGDAFDVLPWELANWIVFGSLGVAFVIMVLCFLMLPSSSKWKAPIIGDTAGNFTNGFATPITAIGALFGTILSSSVLPDDTARLSKNAFVGLNLLFGALILLAPLAYNGVKNQKAQEPVIKKDGTQAVDDLGFGKFHDRGYLGIFVLSSMVTLWAVIGEIFTLAVLVEEIYQQRSLSSAGSGVLNVLWLIALVLIVYYTYKQIRTIGTSTVDDREPTTRTEADPSTVFKAF